MEDELMMALNMYEDKLKTYMTEEDYSEFSKYVAKQMFKVTVNKISDSDFKTFCLNNFDLIFITQEVNNGQEERTMQDSSGDFECGK